MPQAYRFTLPQTQTESARGLLMAAARNYGDSPLATELRKLASKLTQLREPGVAAFYEDRRMRSARGEAEASNG